MNKLLILIALSYAGFAYAQCTSQMITMPDGRTMVCYYCNDGRVVMCENL